MTGKWWISNKSERNLELEKRWKPKEKLKRERKKNNNESDEIEEIQNVRMNSSSQLKDNYIYFFSD